MPVGLPEGGLTGHAGSRHSWEDSPLSRMQDGLSCHGMTCGAAVRPPARRMRNWTDGRQVGAKDLDRVCPFFWVSSVTVVIRTCGLQGRAARFFLRGTGCKESGGRRLFKRTCNRHKIPAFLRALSALLAAVCKLFVHLVGCSDHAAVPLIGVVFAVTLRPVCGIVCFLDGGYGIFL